MKIKIEWNGWTHVGMYHIRKGSAKVSTKHKTKTYSLHDQFSKRDEYCNRAVHECFMENTETGYQRVVEAKNMKSLEHRIKLRSLSMFLIKDRHYYD